MPEFTSHQLDAIVYRGMDACVVAGPGSGKTTVLVERYRSLLEERHFKARNILALTFTEKAAANMKARLAELFAHDSLRLCELESAYVSTIHGFCARVLRENSIAAGVDPRFDVLDARESDELQTSCLNAALDELVGQRREDALELIEALHKPDLAGDLRNAYDAIRSAGRTIAEVRAMSNPGVSDGPIEGAARLRELVSSWPGELTVARRQLRNELLEWARKLKESVSARLSDLLRLIDTCPPNHARGPGVKEFKEDLRHLRAWAVDRHTQRFRATVFDVLARFEEIYNERKVAMGSLDFNDLERRTIELLRGNEEIRGRLRAQFRQVMVDEFQDINEQQAELIGLARGEDVFFAVGDANQSIYGFRHARPEIFHDYLTGIRESRKHSASLLHNFRSRGEILRCVETLLHGAEGIDRRELVAGSAFHAKAEPSIEILKIRDGDKDEAAAKEARWVASRILALRATLRLTENGSARSPEFRDFAVLCRNSESMTPILEAFHHANIPYVCGRRQSFLLSRTGLDITALLHTIENPRDGISLAALLRSDLVGAGDEALLRLRLLAGSLPGGLNILAHDGSKLAEFEPAEARKLARFIGNLKRWRAGQPVLPMDVFIARALSDCGFEWTPGSVDGGNVESFLQLARAKGEDRGLAGFLREIESLRDAVNSESDLSDADQGDCVQVMTAHSAKGLEFAVTIVAAMDKGTQRISAPATFTPEFGLGLKWKDPGGDSRENDLGDSWQLRNAERLREREKQEAHRLLYVAMTRAKEHLILSYSQSRSHSQSRKKPLHWARILDEFFQLDSRAASDEPETHTVTALNEETFDVSIRVTEAEPPPLRIRVAEPVNGEEVPRVPRPVVSDQHDSAVNVTALTLFADCPRKYYLQRYIGWGGSYARKFDPEDLPEETEEADLTAAELGSAVHEILAGKAGAHSREAQRLANVFFESDLGRRAAAAPRREREWDFIVDAGGMLVSGTVDLWFEEAGGIVIVDYKTDSRPRPEAYVPQLALYAIAIERAFGKRPVEGWLHFLRSNTAVKMTPDDAVFRYAESLLAELAQAQDGLRFDLREGEHCRACQFHRGLCQAGQNPGDNAHELL